MNHVVKTLETELKALDTRIESKNKTKRNFEVQLNDITVEIYQMQIARNELVHALNTLSVEDSVPVKLDRSE